METKNDGLDVVKDTVAAQEPETSTMEQPEQTMEQPISDNTDWQAEAKKFHDVNIAASSKDISFKKYARNVR